MAPFVARWAGAAVAGAGGEGQGRAALCSSQQSGLQFPQTWEPTGGPGPPQHDSDEVMFTEALTHAFTHGQTSTHTGVKGGYSSDIWSRLKGTVHPKIQIQSLNPQHHADGKSETFCCPANISGASQQNSVAAFTQTTEELNGSIQLV